MTNDYDELLEDPVYQAARLGKEAESFSRSNLGRYMKDRAQLEVDRLKEELIEIDPSDVRNATKVRNQIFVARQFHEWLEEVIVSGMMAADELEQRESYD